MSRRAKLILPSLLVLVACLIPSLRADVKATNVVYAWDDIAGKMQNSNVITYTNGAWVPFLHEISFDATASGVGTGMIRVTSGTSPITVTTPTGTNHGLVTGDKIRFEGILPGDPTELNGRIFQVTVGSTTTFTIGADVNGLPLTVATGCDNAGTNRCSGDWNKVSYGSIANVQLEQFQVSLPNCPSSDPLTWQGPPPAGLCLPSYSTTITTTQPHGLQTGNSVRLTGILGTLALNGKVYKVTVIGNPLTSTSFTLQEIDARNVNPHFPYYAPYQGGGTFVREGNVIASASNAQTCVITSATTLPYPVGSTITVFIQDVQGMTNLNSKTFTATVSSSTTLTLNGTNSAQWPAHIPNTGTWRAVTSTTYSGTMEYSVYHEDVYPKGATAGAPGFQATRNWRLCDCDIDRDGDFDAVDLATPIPEDNPPAALPQYYFEVIPPQDIHTPCTTGNCQWEIATRFLLNFDMDFDNVRDPMWAQPEPPPPAGTRPASSNRICFFAQALKPGTPAPAFSIWTGNVQARISAGGGDKTVNFNFRLPPTIITLESFEGYEQDGQAVVQWVTADERHTAGFRLLRYDPGSAKYLPVTDQLLPALPSAPMGGTYRYIDSSAVLGGTYRYLLMEVENKGRENEFGAFEVRFIRRAGAQPPPLTSVFEATRRLPQAVVTPPAPGQAKKPSEILKITVGQGGLYRLTAAQISTLTGNNLNLVKSRIQTANYSLSNRGVECAYLAEPDGLSLIFYAEGLDDPYTTQNVYWLKPGRGQKIQTVPGPDLQAQTMPSSFVDTVTVEQDVYENTGLFHDPTADFWTWDYLFAPFLNSKSVTISCPDPGGSSGGTLTVRLLGQTDLPGVIDHHVIVKFNGQKVGEQRWDGLETCDVVCPIPAGAVRAQNTVVLEAVADPGVSWSYFHYDSFELSYSRLTRAAGDRLEMDIAATQPVSVTGFTGPSLAVFDLSNRALPKLLTTSKAVQTAGGGFAVTFQPQPTPSTYVAVNRLAIPICDKVEPYFSSNLIEKQNQADYIVIAPSSLTEAGQLLAQYRAQQGFKTKVVPVTQIFDEFNHGLYSPEAIRNFLAHATNNWRLGPKYVVLLGDGTYDYKNIMGMGDNFVPTMLTNSEDGLFASDTLMADILGDDGIPDLAIGRIPVHSAAELEAQLRKIAEYEFSLSAPWRDNVLLVADSADDAGSFDFNSDGLGSLLAGNYAVSKLHLADVPMELARITLQSASAEGLFFLNYMGHGSSSQLAGSAPGSGLLRVGDVAALGNDGKPFVLAAITCSAGRFEIPGSDCLSEALVLSPEGGAIAAWSPTGYSYHDEAFILDNAFAEVLGTGSNQLLGDVIQAAFAKSAGKPIGYMPRLYNLLGDPALRIR